MIQDHGKMLKEYVEVVEMVDNVEVDLDKPYLEYGLLFICVLFVTYEGQDCRTFRFGCIDMNVVVIDNLLPNFVSNGEYIDAIFLLGDEIFVVNEAFF